MHKTLWVPKIISLISVLGLLGVGLSAPRAARADTGFLGTVGIGVAVGTVLGASTLPFYSQPGTQVSNLLYGASIGAVVGVGAWFYGLANGAPQQDYAATDNLTHLEFTRPTSVYMPLVSLNW